MQQYDLREAVFLEYPLTLCQWVITLYEHRMRFKCGDGEIHALAKRDSCVNRGCRVLKVLCSYSTATFTRHIDFIVNNLMAPLPCFVVECCPRGCMHFIGKDWEYCASCGKLRATNSNTIPRVYGLSIEERLRK